MDKSILKKFAIESRKDLMEKMKNKINTFYVSEYFNKEQKGDLYILSNEKHSLSLTYEECKKRDLLLKRIKELSLEQVIEEAAYTWFNRIIAIRYMEINDMLPLTRDNQSLGIRILSSKDNTPDPEILKFINLMNPDLDIDFKKDKYAELKDDSEKFKYVLLLVCKKLGRVIPQVFDGVTDYIDILIPDNLLNDAGFVTKVVNDVPEDNYKQVEIIGWLYQYYISEKKDFVFKKLKNNVKILKENVPAATQLFTPDWIVKYMVENTICKYVIDNKILNENKIIENFKYYIKREDNIIDNTEEKNSIENMQFIDPCCGSGHILVYAFQVLYKIYLLLGYRKSDISQIIINKNIYGIDLDERAKQLSILSLVLTANKYDNEILNKHLDIKIYSILETNNIDTSYLEEICDKTEKEQILKIKQEFKDAREYGSLIKLESQDITTIVNKINKDNTIFGLNIKNDFIPILKIADVLGKKYDICVTNPPYMGQKGMTNKLLSFVKKNYNDSKTDTFSCFIEKAAYFTKENGYYAMITQPSFLFLSSFDKLRKKIVENKTILSVLHMGRGVFGVDFGSVAFVIKNAMTRNNIGAYYKLHKKTFQYIDVKDIETIFLNAKDNMSYKYDFSKYVTNNEIENVKEDMEEIESEMTQIKYLTNQDNFLKIKGCPFAYWASENVIKLFSQQESLSDVSEPRAGLQTSDNNRFLRNWQEVDFTKIGFNFSSREFAKRSNKKWFPYNKGGEFRKWYGNNYYLVNYENDGYEIKEFVKEKYKNTNYAKDFTKEKWDKLIEVWVVKNQQFYFKKSITWSFVSSANFGVRLSKEGYIFDVGGSSIFPEENEYYYIAGLLNSKLSVMFLKILNPTMNFQVGDIKKIPFINIKNKSIIEEIIKKCAEVSKQDWNSFEISWNFKKHPLLEFIDSMPELHDSNIQVPIPHLKKIKNNYGEECFIIDELPIRAKISDSYDKWKEFTKKQFYTLKRNEEELNKIFIEIYGLQDELTPEEDDKDVTIRKADQVREIKSLISYAVGCMFGRYSLDKEGLIYAGGDFDEIYRKCKKEAGGWAGVSLANYRVLNDNGEEIDLSFEVDNDNIILITDEAYFKDDIVERFKEFISVVYGKETLNENLDFIAETLGKKGTETSEDTIRRYFVNDFFNDHVKTYQKRPIYWLFDSGKKNGFKALIYMHRYNENLVPKIRLDYLHRMQAAYEKMLDDINYKLTTELSMTDKKEAQKRQANLNAKLQEIKEYDEKIANVANQRIKIDLDDGVKVNYEKISFENPETHKIESVLAKIK